MIKILHIKLSINENKKWKKTPKVMDASKE